MVDASSRTLDGSNPHDAVYCTGYGDRLSESGDKGMFPSREVMLRASETAAS